MDKNTENFIIFLIMIIGFFAGGVIDIKFFYGEGSEGAVYGLIIGLFVGVWYMGKYKDEQEKATKSNDDWQCEIQKIEKMTDAEKEGLSKKLEDNPPN